MPAYAIAHIDVKDPVRYEDYKKMSPISIGKFGGRFLVPRRTGGGARRLVAAEALVLLEFPSVEVAAPGGRRTTTPRPKPSARPLRLGDMIILEGFEPK